MSSPELELLYRSRDDGSKLNFGSGFIIEESGYIITTHHVVSPAQAIKIRIGENLHSARVIISDAKFDLAVLKIDARLPAIEFHPSIAKLSQPVIALGFPNPCEYGSSITVTEGSINSLSGYQDKQDHLQISTLVDRGFSGGPLIDERTGGIVGVIVQQHKRNLKCGYAIKAEVLLNFLAIIPPIVHAIKYSIHQGICREEIVEHSIKSTIQVIASY